MKDKVLFAKTGIARFMALLVTLLTMFASCNFVGGQDARTPTISGNDPGKYNGMFKSVIQGLGLQILAEPNGDGTYNTTARIDSDGNIVVKKLGWWGCSYGAWDSDGANLTGKYDVSDVAYVKFDLKADSEGSVYASVFGDKENKRDFNLERKNDDVEDDMIEIKDIKINIVNKKEEVSELVIFGNGDGEIHTTGSKIRVENFAFYDENGKEVVPAYIKYAEGENPETPDNPGTEEGAFKGFFKSPIQGSLDTQIWANGETFAFDTPTISVLAPDGWWGGAIILKDKNERYDVSEIVSVSFDIVSDRSGKLYVNTFQKANSDANSDMEYAIFDLALEAGVQRTAVKIGRFPALKEKVDSLVAFGGDASLQGAKVTITNFTFYDRTGKEVVPQIAKDDGNQGGGENDGTPTLPDDSSTVVTLDGVKYNYGGENGTWFGQQDAWDPTEQQPTVEQSSEWVKVTVKEKNGTQQWKGQIKLKSDTEVASGKKYDISIVVRSTQTFNESVTYKPQLMSKTNENDNYAFEVREKQTVRANQDETVEFKGKSVDKDGTFQMTFDFPGCEVGTEILIKSLTFKESADQTKDDFVVTGDIPNGVGTLTFNFEGEISGDKSYKVYVGDSETPVITMGGGINENRKIIEFKQDFNEFVNDWPYCRKVSEVFTKGAGEYDIKVVPVIDGKEDKSKTMTSKYTLSEDSLGWQPAINGMVVNPIGDAKKPTGFIIAYAENKDIDSFNIFVIKSDEDRDRSQNKWWSNAAGVKGGGAITDFNADNPSITMKEIFKGGAGKYNVYIEPRNSDKTGTNFAMVTLDVEDSWLSDSTD